MNRLLRSLGPIMLGACLTGWSSASAVAETVTEKWTRDYIPAEPPAGLKALATDSAGDVLIVLTDHNSTMGNRIYTAKYSGSDGHVIWEKFMDAALLAQGLALDSQGNPAILNVRGVLKNECAR